MLATVSTKHVALSELSGRVASMIQVILQNSIAIDWPAAGCVELHFNEREVHAKMQSRLHTQDRDKKESIELGLRTTKEVDSC